MANIKIGLRGYEKMFIPRDALSLGAERATAAITVFVRLSVCLSVCLFVTLSYRSHTGWVTSKVTVLHG